MGNQAQIQGEGKKGFQKTLSLFEDSSEARRHIEAHGQLRSSESREKHELFSLDMFLSLEREKKQKKRKNK